MSEEIDRLIALTDFLPGDETHITLGDPAACLECEKKICLTVCPSGVFHWSGDPEKPLDVLYRRCVECGACRLACPRGAVTFAWPEGGRGVAFREG